MQHGLLVIEDNDAVIIGSETNSQGSVDLCLYHNPCCILTCLTALEARGIAAKGMQHGLIGVEDESRFIYFALCCIVTCSLSVFSQLSL